MTTTMTAREAHRLRIQAAVQGLIDRNRAAKRREARRLTPNPLDDGDHEELRRATLADEMIDEPDEDAPIDEDMTDEEE